MKIKGQINSNMSPTNPKPWLGEPLAFLGLLLVLFLVFLGALWFNGALATEWPMLVVAFLLILLPGLLFPRWLTTAQVYTIFDPADVLVHWHYTPAEWQAYVAREVARHTVDWERMGTGLLSVLFLLGGVMGLTMLLGAEAGSTMLKLCLFLFAAMLPLGAYIYGVLPWLARWRIRSSPPEAVIAKSGLYVTQQATLWGAGRKDLHSVRWVAGQPPLLEFTVKWSNRGAEHFGSTYVPVPQGEEVAARQVLQSLQQ